MLTVKTPDEALEVIRGSFCCIAGEENVPLDQAAGRVLCKDIYASEYVPGFDRSTVDGYAVRAADTFGCTDAIPAILEKQAGIEMGSGAEPLRQGCCAPIPTGGALPEGADAAVMQELAEDYGDGTVGITKPAAPGMNIIYRGDDVYPGKPVLKRGKVLSARHIGALAAMGMCEVPVYERIRVGIISTGDELVEVEKTPAAGQIRDVNTAMLAALCREMGCDTVEYGIVRDEEKLIGSMLDRALNECHMVLMSGGSSVGEKDAACRIMAARGEILFHGIAMKPGKPTILCKSGKKPVIGLPGHPGATFLVSRLLLPQLLCSIGGREVRRYPVQARLAEPVSANHGRAQYTAVKLMDNGENVVAVPARGQSGLITNLAYSDGFFCIPRDTEGAAAGETVQVYLYDN